MTSSVPGHQVGEETKQKKQEVKTGRVSLSVRHDRNEMDPVELLQQSLIELIGEQIPIQQDVNVD
jgi:septum formation topological specificity factor MinE